MGTLVGVKEGGLKGGREEGVCFITPFFSSCREIVCSIRLDSWALLIRFLTVLKVSVQLPLALAWY